MFSLHKTAKHAVLINRLLIGLLFLMTGIMKAFVMKPGAVAGFFGSLGIPIPLFFAWVVLLSEIIFGLALLANYKVELTVLPLMIILIVASLTAVAPWKNFPQNMSGFFMHLIITANLWMIGSKSKSGEMHS